MKSSRAPQMFITSLHMRHWRNFRGPVDIDFFRFDGAERIVEHAAIPNRSEPG